MKRRDLILIENYFREYYYKNVNQIIRDIYSIDSREFGYIDFNDIMRRHIALKPGEFKEWLLENVPKHFYHSSAYYMFPEKEMGAKIWEGGDLVFDIDLDHIKGYDPKKIIVCVEDKNYVTVDDVNECKENYKEIIFLDSEGVSRAKKELVNLLETLNRDFDIKLDSMKIYFSGARGYHVHITNDQLLKLDSYARMEIKDYLTYDGFDIRYAKSINARPVVTFLSAVINSDERLNIIFSTDEIDFLKSISNIKDFSLFLKRRNKEEKIIKKINIFISKFLGIQIDGVVTADISRLIRVPHSLHGKTGLRKTQIPYDSLDSFDPFSDAVRKDEEKIRLKVLYCPKTFWYNDEYGPYFNDEVVIPFSLGIYLSMNELAEDLVVSEAVK